MIKVHALIEAAVSHLLAENLQRHELIAVFSRIDVALLSEPRNIGKDAFLLLEDAFPVQHTGYLSALGAMGLFGKWRLRKAWLAYYGDENEEEWWLPNEYGTLLSNKVENTAENTKS